MISENTKGMVIKMEICSLASGSSGNCSYIGNSNTNLLVDTGVSCKKIENGLKNIDVDPSNLDGVLITHEHTDHINSLGTLAKRYNIPVYGTKETLEAILSKKKYKNLSEQRLIAIEPDKEFLINDIIVEPFSISHDAANPVCYTFKSNGSKIGMANDLGEFTDYTVSKLESSNILFLESNHDENMLMVGQYPYFLKQRISGKEGHLSNENSADLISRLFHNKLKYISLIHLSRENNLVELAYETAKQELSQHTSEQNVRAMLSVAKRDEHSEVLSTT